VLTFQIELWLMMDDDEENAGKDMEGNCSVLISCTSPVLAWKD
jgi:hypothetical protein